MEIDISCVLYKRETTFFATNGNRLRYTALLFSLSLSKKHAISPAT